MFTFGPGSLAALPAGGGNGPQRGSLGCVLGVDGTTLPPTMSIPLPAPASLALLPTGCGNGPRRCASCCARDTEGAEAADTILTPLSDPASLALPPWGGCRPTVALAGGCSCTEEAGVLDGCIAARLLTLPGATIFSPGIASDALLPAGGGNGVRAGVALEPVVLLALACLASLPLEGDGPRLRMFWAVAMEPKWCA